jgi:hypothetical protein
VIHILLANYCLEFSLIHEIEVSKGLEQCGAMRNQCEKMEELEARIS